MASLASEENGKTGQIVAKSTGRSAKCTFRFASVAPNSAGAEARNQEHPITKYEGCWNAP
jgi:hypothetical protein